MRRTSALAVDTNVVHDPPSCNAYELTQSPSTVQTIPTKFSSESSRVSLNTVAEKTCHEHTNDATNDAETSETPPPPTRNLPQPSIRLLFSLVSRRDVVLLLSPAIVASLVSGGVAPFMTVLIGQVFDAFARFPLSNPTPEDRSTLRNEVGLASLQLLALAVGALALGSITSALWISTGERNVMRLRTKVYEAVTSRSMEWFDTKMGGEDAIVSIEGDGPVGAGGLMAKFARETDEVRMASSLASGMLLQYLTTCITCLVLAFFRSWALTLVILSAVPTLIITQALSQKFAGPLVGAERHHSAVAATLVERAVSAISTVKAFNAALDEQRALGAVLDRTKQAATRVHGVWGITSALSQFTSMAMFVQAFWFGAKMVRDGSVSPGNVMAVFWACLIATSNLQMCIPQFIVLAKGKFAMVSLISLVEPPAPTPDHLATPPARIQETLRASMSTHSHLTLTPLTPDYSVKRTYPQPLRKIQPLRCSGEFALTAVSFAYPSRATLPVLSDVSLYLPASETTFIVGGSGSGKSTIAQLLARLYFPTQGVVTLDDHDVENLDEEWVRRHVAVVSQSCILFEGSVHENVAMGVAGSGRDPKTVERREVVGACTAALMHEFVRDLPQGYDTQLGTGGANLSGGQKQRLAIARAMIRNPTVMILDEATSALDATSRVLVFEAVKAWRKDRTMIVITHDLSQITANDFVYVLRSGTVVEQGYREDLETQKDGEFRAMMLAQGDAGGFPTKDDPEPLEAQVEKFAEIEFILEQAEKEKDEECDRIGTAPRVKHQSGLFGNWMLDVVSDLTRSRASTPLPPAPATVSDKKERRQGKHMTLALPTAFSTLPRGRTSFQPPTLSTPPKIHTDIRRHFSLQFTPTSPTNEKLNMRWKEQQQRPPSVSVVEDDEEFELEKAAMERTAAEAMRRRIQRSERVRWDDEGLARLSAVKVEDDKQITEARREEPSFRQLIRDVYPTLPQKPLIAFGMLVCVLSGAMTPIFSYLLSRLLFEVSIGARNVSTINVFGGIVLAVAATDGILMGTKFFVMETAAINWVTRIRKRAYAIVLAQDKKWFDKSEHAPVRIVQTIIKDGDDARNLIAVVLGQCLVVVAMLGVGLIWALARGWQLTLAGFAIGPVFAVVMSVQARLQARCERNNKAAREEVSKGYYEAISNTRAIRSMSFESVFRQKFDESVEKAYTTGVRGAFVEGCTFGVANGLIYLAEALLFFVGAVLVAQGTYSYLQMVEVLNLVVFTVSIGSQLMAFTQRIAKSTAATRDFNMILMEDNNTDESRGVMKPPVDGAIQFSDVHFSYPERADVPVLQGASFRLERNECVAVVGGSGSGKSTVAALLQRLYEPNSGSITIGSTTLSTVDVHHLREHVSVVSQHANLFDATIAENIAYGNKSMPIVDIHSAAKAARVHDFIMSLPKGYDTPVGENAALISGGQAQRIQIARALARPSNILILDECTSALDPANQAAVMETIRLARVGRTTLVVTHKLVMMQMCDRILVVHGGVIAEEGSYEDLMRRNGVFAQLASGGEWSGE